MTAPRARVLSALIAGTAAVHVAPAPAAIAAPARRLFDIRATVGDPRAVAVTFDDGPHTQGTPAVLDRLAQARARATFFLVGEQVQRHRALVAEIVAAGHEVALHGHTHRGHLRLRPATVADDLRRGADVVAAAAGQEPRLHRPPFGHYSSASLRLVRRAGLEPLLWSRHGRDWSRRASAASIAARLGSGVAAGEVILLHDADHYGTPGSWRATADALPRLFEALAHAGLEVRPA